MICPKGSFSWNATENRDFYKQAKNPYLDFGLKILVYLDDSANSNKILEYFIFCTVSFPKFREGGFGTCRIGGI